MRYLETCFSEVEVIKDLPFTEAVHIQNYEMLKLDIYSPQGDKETKRPTILWIHGGGFRPGRDKGQNYIVEFARRFALKGYVCVASDYRLRENPSDDIIGTISDAVTDVSLALKWIRNNNEAYGIDRERLFIAGGSAGGMIAVNLCYGDGSCGRKQDLSGVLAMMNLWGSPQDLRLDVHANSIPALTVHGTADEMVNIENSYNFIDILNKAGVKNVFIPLEGAPHTPMVHVEKMDYEFSRFLSDFLRDKQ